MSSEFPGEVPHGVAASGPISLKPVPPQATVTEPSKSAEVAPTPPALTPERLASEIRPLDWGLRALVVVFAFFLGSTVAHNSDIWLHLATGRLIANGEYTFGSDPFTYTSGSHSWINHAWLTQWIGYKILSAMGGADSSSARFALVVIKALLVAALAFIMLMTRRREVSSWLAAACVALALYAMSLRLYLQPAVISYFFLAITLFVLYRWRKGPRSWTYLAVLPVLFAMWVNMDEWYLLGPLTVVLFLIAEVAQLGATDTGERTSAGDLGQLGAIAIIGAGACLLNPQMARGLTLPTDVWAYFWGRDLQADPWFQQYFYSGLGRDYLVSAGAWAYALLLGLGIGSFVLLRGEFPWWRLSIWCVFALLSIALARAIPFFAVVAGPITALNLQDFSAKQFGILPRVEGNLKNWSLWGRLASLCLAVLVLAVAWPGYLHASPDDPRRSRRVAWDVDIDPSLRLTADKLCELRQQGVIRSDSRGFNSNPDIANYCAWFCPSEKSFFDYRLQLFPDVLKTYTDTKVALHPKPGDPAQDNARWRSVFANPNFNIDHIIINHPEQTATLAVVEKLWRDSDEWTLLYMDGQSTIFGWDNALEPSQGRHFPSHRLNMPELAWGKSIPAADRAPDNTRKAPEKPNFWSWYLNGPARRSLEVERTAMYLTYAEEMSAVLRRNAGWSNFVTRWTAPVASAPTTAGALIYTATVGPLLALSPGQLYSNTQTAPPDALMLAVRAARRAIDQSPENPDGYLALAQAYHTLWESQEKLWSKMPSSDLEKLRRTVIVNSYRTALALRPEDYAIHFLLAEFYARMNYLDLEMDAWAEGIRALRAAGPRPRQPLDEYNKRLNYYEQGLRNREQSTRLQELRDDYELKSANKPPLTKAQLALQRGLVKQAIEVLSEADPKTQLGPRGEGAQMLFQLYTDIGRGEEMVNAGFRVEDYQQMLLAIVAGDYKLARELLQQMAKGRERAAVNALIGVSWAQIFQGQIQPSSAIDVTQFLRVRNDVIDLENLRAILSIEAGDTKEAAAIFNETLKEKFPTGQGAAAIAPLGATVPVGAAGLLDAESRARIATPPGPSTASVAAQYAKLLKAQGN